MRGGGGEEGKGKAYTINYRTASLCVRINVL